MKGYILLLVAALFVHYSSSSDDAKYVQIGLDAQWTQTSLMLETRSDLLSFILGLGTINFIIQVKFLKLYNIVPN